jgi:hypothetical protein
VIDKVDLRIPGTADWTSRVRFSHREIFYEGRSTSFLDSKHYWGGVADLRRVGLDAILHAYCRYGKRKDHKLELIETGKKSLAEMAAIATAVFEVEICKVMLIRLDLAADMPDIPVECLRRCMRVQLKRKTDEWGVLKYEEIGNRKIEYLRFGRSPNLIRVYDKVAERKAHFARMLKHVSPDAELPTFEETFGFPEDATLTRIERQSGGGRIPPELATFGSLKNAADFDPFTAVKIIPTGIPVPDPGKYGPADTAKILGIHQLIEREGFQNAFARLNRDHNAKRLTEPYIRFMQDCAPALRIDRERVTESFRQSVTRQIEGGANKIPNTQISRLQEESRWAVSMR